MDASIVVVAQSRTPLRMRGRFGDCGYALEVARVISNVTTGGCDIRGYRMETPLLTA